jgi:hypothetical protein
MASLVVNGFTSVLEGDDTMADIDAALGRHLEVAFHNVA